MEKRKIITKNTMQVKDSFKVFSLLLFIFNVIFLFFVLSVFYYGVPLTDDFCFIKVYKQDGIFGGILTWYNEWQGRFLPQLFTSLSLLSFEKLGTLILYPIVFLTTFICAVTRILKHFTPANQENNNWYLFLLINFSAFFFSGLLLFHFDISSFFWITVGPMYFGAVLMFLVGLSELLSARSTIPCNMLLGFCFFYIGCSSEHVGLLMTVCLTLVMAYLWVFKGKSDYIFLKITRNLLLKRITLSWVMCLISFLIMYFAPGNEIRQRGYPPPSIQHAIMATPSSLYAFLLNTVAGKIKYVFFIFFPFVFLGNLNRNQFILSARSISRITLITLGAIFIGVATTIFIFQYAIAWEGPSRAYVHVSFLFVGGAAFLGYLFGANISKEAMGLVKPLAFISIFVYLVMGYQRNSFHLPDTKAYSAAIKNRLAVLDSLKKSGYTGSYTLPALPVFSRNVLHCAEMSADKNDLEHYFINECTRDALQLNFDIFVEKRK